MPRVTTWPLDGSATSVLSPFKTVSTSLAQSHHFFPDSLGTNLSFNIDSAWLLAASPLSDMVPATLNTMLQASRGLGKVSVGFIRGIPISTI